jgi:hypothetical protein
MKKQGISTQSIDEFPDAMREAVEPFDRAGQPFP